MSHRLTKDFMEELMKGATAEVWQSGGAGREAIREELAVGWTRPILLPQDYPDLEFNNGVGSPFVVNHPESPSKYTLLFTGWTTDDGDDRRVFAADIDPISLKISNIRGPLATRDDFPTGTGDGIVALHLVWDSLHKNWIATCSVESTAEIGTPPNRCHLCAMRFDEGITRIIASAEYYIDIMDSGASIIIRRQEDYRASLIAADSQSLRRIEVDDYTKLPEGTATVTKKQFIVQGGPDPSTPNVYDINHAFILNNTLVILAEVNQRSCWMIQAGISPVLENGLLEDIRVPMSSTPIFQQNLTAGHPHSGMPHYASLMGRPMLFFAWFRGLGGGSISFRHEIWAQRLRGDEFRPEILAPRDALGPVDANESGLWMPTYGRDVTILWDAGEAGTIYVDKCVSITEGRAGRYQTDTISITGAEIDYITFTRPPNWIRIRTSGFATPDIKTWAVFH